MEETLNEALRHWRDVNFGALQKELDTQGMTILNNQKESINSRKALADQTREFKRLSDEEKAGAFKTVLKSYQTEIDNLTKRSKFAETAFLSVYKLLADAPDPVPMLASALDEVKHLPQLEALTIENKRLRDELDDATKDFVDMKNQSSTVVRLKEKLAEYETKMDKQVKQKVLERETQLREEHDTKIRVYKEREFELERQLSRCKDQIATLQTNNDSNQATIFSHSLRFDETVSAKLAELEIISLELERATERASVAERDREVLRQELIKSRETLPSPATPSTTDNKHAKQYEEVLASKEAEIRKLQDAMGKLNKASVSKQVTHSSMVMDLQTRMNEQTEEIEALKERLAEFRDYDDIKRELAILKVIEFSPPSSGTMDEKDNSLGTIADGASLEALLMRKNKQLQDDLTSLKVMLSATEVQLKDAIQREHGSRDIIAEQQVLITKLEEDLVAINLAVSTKSTEGLSGLMTTSQTSTPESRTAAQEVSVVQIITNQRDRYRKRTQELEEKILKLQKSLDEQQGRLKMLTDDNVKLYEKIRFLEGYNEARGGVPTSVRVDMANVSTTASSGGGSTWTGDVVSKYRPMYEERINPFTEFNERERRKGYYNLNVAERATLNVSRFFLANKYARMFIFFYAVLLHLLVLSVIYGMSAVEECVHDHAVAAAESAT